MGKYHNTLDYSNENTSYFKLLSQISSGSRVLEFGPAEGVLTRYLKEKLLCSVYIVEIDPLSYETAIQYAEDGVLGDIEAFEWEDKFIGIQFDYILFADVLEHLRNPGQVLQRSGGLLRDNGIVLVSVPNIGHNDVLLSLYDNHFDYTETGLLDMTHIRFFAYENLRAFFEEAGFRIFRENYVEMKTFHTEQAERGIGNPIGKQVFSRPCGEIYQFILTACKKECQDYSSEANTLIIRDMLAAEVQKGLHEDIYSAEEYRKKNGNRTGYNGETSQWKNDLLLETTQKKKKSEEEKKTNQLEQEAINLQRESELVKLNKEKEKTIRQLQKEKAQIQSSMQQIVQEKNEQFRVLTETETELQRIYHSRSWKMMIPVWKMRDILVPKDSLRRKAIKSLITPIGRLGRSQEKNIANSNIEGLDSSLNANSQEFLSSNSDSSFPHTRFQISRVEGKGKREKRSAVRDYPGLAVPHVDIPLVSIVIPAYNQFDYTYLCIKSILDHSGSIPFEIILADDNSTDLTLCIEQVISGMTVLHNQENMRFLRNCNNASRYAKGKYILFLNNDTQVQENWLASLVKTMESDDSIGMTGSKLVYPNGELQEAGGIVWKDGSACNYGNGLDPFQPEFSYVKEVDYISGASIMIRKCLWEQIGGFDERFAPAYYEDTDLAFQVRHLGYKAIYQPDSIVVHFEGISNGKEISDGQKRYQAVNQKKFFRKWKDTLEKEHSETGVDLFYARDRSRDKETVLVIDHYIPTYDKDAGSRSMDTYLTLLVKMDFHVMFLGDNFLYDRHYAHRYEQMGIEMLCGDFYLTNWKSWLEDHSECFDYVFLSRPHISIKYIDFFAKYTDAKIIYYVQDLHFLREKREYEITHDPALLESARRLRKQEMYIMKNADVVLTLSNVEKQIIDKNVPGEKAVVIPISCYYSFPSNHVSLSEKNDIIFVGGFSHRPNEDGILWFLDEVWEKLYHAIPDSRLVIIGSNPTDKVLARQSENVFVTGFVTDEELEEHYRKCRVCIIPLRYGAGVKGKTLEAMYHRVPIVSTSVGIEGLVGIEQYIEPADDPESFCEKIIELYQDTEKSVKIAERYIEYLQEHNSYETVRKLFTDIFKPLEEIQ